MARNPQAARARGRSWSPPSKTPFAAVDLDAKDKKVDRQPDKADVGGRRPGDGRGYQDPDTRDPIDRAGMSRSMQKRIARARAEGERTAQQRLADDRAADQREISDLRKRLHGIEVQGKVSSEEQKHNQDMSELEARLEKAHTDGNHADIATLQRQISEKASAWETRKRELLATPVESPQRRAPQNTGPTPEGRAWIAANNGWYDKPGYEAETAAVIAIDQRLMANGSDPNSPDHYRKIRSEMRKKFRDIDVVDPNGDDADLRRTSRDEDEDDDRDTRRRSRSREEDDDDEDDERDDSGLDGEDRDDDEREEDLEEEEESRGRQSRRPSFMSFGEEGQRRQGTMKVRNGRVVLSQKDRETMQRFNMDPDNDKHVEQWARTRRENAENSED